MEGRCSLPAAHPNNEPIWVFSSATDVLGQSPSFRFQLRIRGRLGVGMDISLARTTGMFYSSPRVFCVAPSTLHPFSSISTMSSHNNLSSAFHHYVPSDQKYHVQSTPSNIPPPPARMVVQPHPPPQTCAYHPSSDGNIKPLRNIKPTPSTTSTKVSMLSLPKTSSPRGSPSGHKQYKFVQCSPC